MNSARLAGLQLGRVPSLDSAARELLLVPQEGRRIRVHLCTMHTLAEAERSKNLHEGLASADYVLPDGMPLVWALRVSGRGPAARVCGPDLMPKLIDRGRRYGYRHFFVGGAPGVAVRLQRRFEWRYPGCSVVGTLSPPYGRLDAVTERKIISMINGAEPDYVWVGLGTPKQDHWLIKHRSALNASALLAVGAAFDFHAGTIRRAPRWMRGTGLEWAYRLSQEPRRLWRRYTYQVLPAISLIVGDSRVARGINLNAVFDRHAAVEESDG